MLTIFEKEEVYRQQMTGIRTIVLDFAEEIKWEPISRGRKAHVSLCGPTNGFRGVIDIEIERLDWDEMPERLTDRYPFTLWCSGFDDRSGKRKFLRFENHWTCTYIELPRYTRKFLDASWMMLTSCSESDLVDEWPGPSLEPDRPPNFGPPRIRPRKLA